MKNNRKGGVLLADVIDWGQGYDDTIVELLQAFQKFRDGYYELINYGDDWWEKFNQGRDFDEIMKEQWEKFESVDFMNLVEKMAVAIAGTYVRFDEFANGVVDAYNNGNGLRHKVEPQAIPTGAESEGGTQHDKKILHRWLPHISCDRRIQSQPF